MPYVPKRTGISEILLALRRLLSQSVQSINEDRIFIVARNQSALPAMQAPTDILMRPRGFTTNQEMVASAGRYTTQLTRIIDIIIRHRRELDKVGEDSHFLTDDPEGYFEIEEQAIGAVQVIIDGEDSQLLDPGGNSLLTEPMRIVDGTTPNKYAPTQSQVGFGEGAFGIEVKYLLDLDLDIQ